VRGATRRFEVWGAATGWLRFGLGCGWPLWLVAVTYGCRCGDAPSSSSSDPAGSAVQTAESAQAVPQLLYLPDGGDIAPLTAPGQRVFAAVPPVPNRCPQEMVEVQGRFCIDRYESVLVDHATGRPLSPYYAPTRALARSSYEQFARERLAGKTAEGRTLAVPEPPSWQLEQQVEPRAVVRPGVVPNGYVSAELAERACRNAGKRLCTEQEWVTACRGEHGWHYPYGDSYVHGLCNVFREAHPAQILHGDASKGHLDPRLNLVMVRGRSLLRPTGASSRCRSQWGQDAVYDMVGNLAEWVDDPDGVFLGGFYSRSSRAGCDRRVSTHPRHYLDYSLGVRCCAGPGRAAAPSVSY
jgi:sulfatase modifying factor 1